METLLTHGARIYASVYFVSLLVVCALEIVAPGRPARETLGLRWFGNFAMTILGTLSVRALFPLLGTAWAGACVERGWGLFNTVTLPRWLVFAVTLTALDLSLYAQHVLYHRIEFLWRVHRTHHTDHDYDFSTGVRFHPFETILSAMVSLAVIAAIGAPPAIVFVFQLLTVIVDFAEHANVRVPARLDRLLRLVVITPDVHRIHHSIRGQENHSNFGSVLPWWDRLFGTYTSAPADGHHALIVGVAEFAEPKHQMLYWMLLQPFLGREQANTDVTLAVTETAVER